MSCPGIERDRTEMLSLAFFFTGASDALIEFCEGKNHPELESRVRKVADFIMQNDDDLEPSFKKLVRKKLARKDRHDSYCHIDAFSRFIEGSKYKNRLREVRIKFLSIINEGTNLKTRKRNAEFCIKFLSRAIDRFLYEHEYYVPRTPKGVRKLLSATRNTPIA